MSKLKVKSGGKTNNSFFHQKSILKMAPKQSKVIQRWCFTYNNYPDDWEEKMKALPLTYCVVGQEKGEQGTPHLQGYCEVKPRQRLSAFKAKWVAVGLPGVHLEQAKGTWQQNKEYCEKEGQSKEWGQQPKGQGHRTDVERAVKMALAGKDDAEIAEEVPVGFARAAGAIGRAREAGRKKRRLKKNQEKMKNAQPREWQEEILDALNDQDERKILWCWEETGCVGKTWLANYLEAKFGAYVVVGGKWQDIACAYNGEEFVVFDLARCMAEMVPYGLMESFKNGRVFSPKYQSGFKGTSDCKLIVFANFEPDRSKLSADRWDVHHIAQPQEE